MADVTFDEEPVATSYRIPTQATNSKSIPKWLIAHGITKTESSANILLIVVAAIALIVAIILIIGLPKQRVLSAQERALLEATTPSPTRR